MRPPRTVAASGWTNLRSRDGLRSRLGCSPSPERAAGWSRRDRCHAQPFAADRWFEFTRPPSMMDLVIGQQNPVTR